VGSDAHDLRRLQILRRYVLPSPTFTISSRKADAWLLCLGGNFSCQLTFPPEYPLLPPSLKFQSPIPFHPNIYTDGRLCISILHPPEDDQYGYESAAERWSPVQTPETILLSVVSLLHDPNDESPANVEAARLWREERDGFSKDFRKRCRRVVRESLGED
jgi:ubiquitin-conjugating enzyme E2 G1